MLSCKGLRVFDMLIFFPSVVMVVMIGCDWRAWEMGFGSGGGGGGISLEVGSWNFPVGGVWSLDVGFGPAPCIIVLEYLRHFTLLLLWQSGAPANGGKGSSSSLTMSTLPT